MDDLQDDIPDFNNPSPRHLVRAEAEKQGVDPDLAERVMNQESGGRLNARSPKGAYGPMQLMSGTARQLGVNPRDPYQNIRGGVTYLKQQVDRFGSPKLAAAAYNAGPGAVQRAGNRVPKFKETQRYVKATAGDDIPDFSDDALPDFSVSKRAAVNTPKKAPFAWNAGSTPTVSSARPVYQPAKLAVQSASPDDGRLTPAESAYDPSIGPLGKDFAETITKPAPVIRAARQARQPVRMTLPGQSDEERAAQRATSDAAKVQREESRRTAANQTISNYLGVPLPRVATEAIADAAHGLGEGTGRAIEGAGQYAEDLRRKLGYENTSSAITKAGQSLREMGEQASTVGGAPEGLRKDIATEIGGIIPALLAKNPTMIGELAALQAKGRGATNAEALTQGAMAGLTVGGMGKGASIISRLVPGAGILPALTRFGGRAAVNTAIPIAANAAERAMQGEPIEPPPDELRKEIIHSGVMGAGFALLPHSAEAKRDISRQVKHPYVRGSTVDPSSPAPGFLRRLESFRAEAGRDRVPRDAAIPPRFGNARAQYEAQRAVQEQEPITPRTPVQPTEPGVESAIAQGVGARQPLQSPRLVKRAAMPVQDIKQAVSPVEQTPSPPVFRSETGPVGHDEMVSTLDDLLSLIPEKTTRQRIIDESVAEGGASYENVVRTAFRKAEEATSGKGGDGTPEPPSNSGMSSAPSPVRNLTRNFRAGNNDASMTFTDDTHRDLYDLGAKMRYLGRGGQNKPKQRAVGDIAGLRKSLAERLNLPQADIGRMAMDTLDDVKAQMKGVKHGEGRQLVNNVKPPTPTVTTIKNSAPQARTVNPESDSLLSAIQKIGFDSTTQEGSDLARYLSPREGGRPGMVNNQRLNGGERRGVDNHLIRSLQEAGFDIKDSNDLMNKVRQEQGGKPVYSTAYDHAAQAARELKPYLEANHSPEIAQTVNTLAEAINNHSEFGQLSDKIAHGEAADAEIKRFGEVGRYELNIDPDAIQSFIETHENAQQPQGRGAELGVETGKSSQQLTKRKISKRQDDVKHRDLYDYFPDQFSVGSYDVSKVTSAASARKGEQEYGYRWHDKKSGRLGSVVIRTTDTGDLDIEPVGASKDVPQEVLNELQNQLTPAFNQQMQRGAERAAGEREGDVGVPTEANAISRAGTATISSGERSVDDAGRLHSSANLQSETAARPDYIHDTLDRLTEQAKSTRRSLSDLVDEHIAQAPLPGQESTAFTPQEAQIARNLAANYDTTRSTRRAPVKEQAQGLLDTTPTTESMQASQVQAESQRGEGMANSPLFEGAKVKEPPHHSELQPRTPEGQFDGPPSTPEYVKPSSVETVHQSELQGALQLKADAWKKVKELRTRIANEPLGGNRSGLRLQLMGWQDAHGKAIELERQARQAIESRANELKQTTVKPMAKPLPDFSLKEPKTEPAKGEHGQFINALFKSPDVDNQVPSFLANPEVRAKLELSRTGKPAETKDALAKAMNLPRSSHISPEALRAWASENGLGQDALSAIDSAHAQYRAKLRAKELGGRDDDPDIITQYRNDLGKKSGDLSGTLLSDPERGYKAVTVLGYDLYQTAKDFGNWSRQMVGRLGERIRPMLRDLWNGIKNSDFVKDERGFVRVDTPEFKRWFGKSKVVDEKGEPLEVDGVYINSDQKPRSLPSAVKQASDFAQELEAWRLENGYSKRDGYRVAQRDAKFDDKWPLAYSEDHAPVFNSIYWNAEPQEPTYRLAYRFKDIPKDDYSTNNASGVRENGLSVAGYLSDGEDTAYDSAHRANQPKYIVGGWDLGATGSDGEPLLLYPTVFGKADNVAKIIKPAAGNSGAFNPDSASLIDPPFVDKVKSKLLDLFPGERPPLPPGFKESERGSLRFGKGEKTTTEPVTNKRLERIFKANKGEGDMPPPRRRFKQGALDDLFKTDEKVTVEAAHQTMQDAWDDFTEAREPAKANAPRAGEAYYEQGKKAPDKLLSFRTLDSWMKANMLQGMSPYSHKVGSLASNALAEAASTPGAAAADWVISKAKGGRRSVVVDPKGMGKAAASAVTTGAREAMQIMRQGATQKQIEQYGMPNQLNTRSPIVNAMVNYTFRTYKAGAHIFGTMAYQKALSNQAKAWALNEVTAGKIRGNEVSRRTQEILNGSDIPEGVTATMEGNATLAYADAVFQSENKLNDVRKKIIGTGNGAWAFAVNRVVPFMKSASNAYLKMLDYTGVGPKGAIAETSRAIQRKSNSGQAFRTLEDQRATATAWGKLPVGLGLFTAGIILHRNGLMTSLTYQHDDNPQPGSVRAFGKLIDVARYSPIGLIMAAGATFDELSHDKDNDALTAAVKVVAKGASNLPMFSQTTDLVKTAQALAEGKASVPGIGGAIGKSLLTRTAPTMIPAYATVRDVKGGIEQSDKYVAGPLGKMMHVQNQLTEPRSADEVKIHEADRAAHPLPPISDLKKTELDAKGEITRAMQSHDKNTPAIIQKHIASGAIKQEDVYDIADKASKSEEQRMIEGFKRLPLEEMANQYLKLSPAGRAKVRQEFQEAAMDQLPNLTPLQQKILGPKIGQALRAQ